RAYLADGLPGLDGLDAGDMRRSMPRFQPDTYAHNLTLLAPLRQMARDHDCTPAQLVLAWLLHQGDHVIPIPGTTRMDHLEENLGAVDVQLNAAACQALAALFARDRVAGERYGPATQAEVDTEQFSV